jgi:flagellar biogenesis protein FliO
MLALNYPIAAAVVVIICVVLMIVFAAWILRAVRSRWSKGRLSAAP